MLGKVAEVISLCEDMLTDLQDREDLNNLFDTQVHQLTALIDTQLQSMLRKFADESVVRS